jgi:hypothetical protein
MINLDKDDLISVLNETIQKLQEENLTLKKDAERATELITFLGNLLIKNIKHSRELIEAAEEAARANIAGLPNPNVSPLYGKDPEDYYVREYEY